ncbi:MAG: hypothetical protein AAF621_02520, partial [Pseudomonadota bacterium]
ENIIKQKIENINKTIFEYIEKLRRENETYAESFSRCVSESFTSLGNCFSACFGGCFGYDENSARE